MEPKVSLVRITENPISTMCWARRVMHSPVPNTIQELEQDPEKWLGMDMDTYVSEILLKDKMPTFLEYVSLVFKFENVSRALQQQLTRHRIGFSFSIQSLRCVDLPNFADNGNYTNPNNTMAYYNSMLAIQDIYRAAIDSGVNTQDARGLLPMNIHSTVTFSCNLRSLAGMLNKRLCLKTQDEFRSVAMQIYEMIKDIDSRLIKWFGAPCDLHNYCMMQGENEQQFKDGRLTGKQNTDHCCPKYIKKFKGGKNGKENK